MKKVILAGGSGFIGQLLSDHFQQEGYEVAILTRGANRQSSNKESFIQWSGRAKANHLSLFEESQIVINLTGKNINCRFTEESKRELIDSRVNSTESIGKIISLCNTPPSLWINFSGIARYQANTNHSHNESSTDFDDNFLGVLAQKWEEAMNSHITPNTKKVIVRTGIVLDKEHGALAEIYPLAKLGLGGKQGSGNQILSWIHKDDVVMAINHIVNTQKSGIYNLTSPSPISNTKFMEVLRSILKVPFGFPAPSFAIKLGAWFKNTESELILNGHKVIPERLLSEGYKFKFGDLESAFQDLLS